MKSQVSPTSARARLGLLTAFVSALAVPICNNVALAQDKAPVASQVKLPAGGRALIAPGDVAKATVGKGRLGDSELVKVSGPGFEQAVRATATGRGQSWDLEVRLPIDAKINKGDVVSLRLWVRAPQTASESGQGLMEVTLGTKSAPWQNEFARIFSATDQWQEVYLRGTVWNDREPGTLAVKLGFGFFPQVVEVGGASMTVFDGSKTKLASLPETRATYAGREADAPWRRAADKRIERTRMAPLTVQVINRAGQPVSDATVQVDLQKHSFLFGSAVNPEWLVTDNKPEFKFYRERFAELFNAGSFINSLKWQAWSGEWGAELGRERTMQGLEWMKQRQMPIRGHVMIWGSWRYLPAFVKPLEGKATPEELRRLALSRIDEVALPTADYVSEWDVVNEPRAHHDLMDIIGRPVMTEFFKRARNRLPNAKLVLNDYWILSALTDGPAQDEFEKNARYLIENGAPIDGLGLQGHFASTVPSPEYMQTVLDRYAALGLTLRLTEYSVNGDDDDLKSDFTRDVLTLLYAHPAAVGFQTWELDAFVNKDGSLTPMGRAYQALVKEKWQTHFKAQTDAAGSAETRGYLGQYTVKVTRGRQIVELPFTLRQDSLPLIVTLP